MKYDDFVQQLRFMRANLGQEAARIEAHGDSSLIVRMQLSSLQVVEDSAAQMADNGEVFEV